MKTLDLRIGNWVLIPYQNAPIAIPAHETTIQGITIFGEILTNNTHEHEGLKTHINHVSGIPLTEEWLLKFGFQKIDHINGYSFYTLSKSKVNPCHLDVYEHRTQYMGYSVNHCEYVHQLMNLYFALTGTELTIK